MTEAKARPAEMADQVEGGVLNSKHILGSVHPRGLQDEGCLVLSGSSLLVTLPFVIPSLLSPLAPSLKY